jgi:hypothetical protein
MIPRKRRRSTKKKIKWVETGIGTLHMGFVDNIPVYVILARGRSPGLRGLPSMMSSNAHDWVARVAHKNGGRDIGHAGSLTAAKVLCEWDLSRTVRGR